MLKQNLIISLPTYPKFCWYATGTTHIFHLGLIVFYDEELDLWRVLDILSPVLLSLCSRRLFMDKLGAFRAKVSD